MIVLCEQSWCMQWYTYSDVCTMIYNEYSGVLMYEVNPCIPMSPKHSMMYMHTMMMLSTMMIWDYEDMLLDDDYVYWMI